MDKHNSAEFESLAWQAAESENEWGLGDVASRIGQGISEAAGRVAGAVAGLAAGAGIIDLTAQGDRSVRKGARDMAKIKALVLHQMACCHQRKDPLKSYLGLKAHFAILADGKILQIHPIQDLIWASNGFNNGSVAVEFAGNFPNTKGQWWEGAKFGRNQVTPAQIEAGRRLVRYLVAKIGLRTVVAHRQSSASRENDPGPDIWRGVGQWAVDTLGLSDGGPGFKVGDGNAIPALWRTWGGSKTPAPSKELGEMGELGALGETGESEQGEQEALLGPLTASLKWFARPHSHADVMAKGGNVGGVYIAFRAAPAQGKIKILKVGMTSTFARRMKDPQYIRWARQYPDLRFFLAEVRGNRGNRGIAGVVRMVELALARLLRRAGELTGPQLPHLPVLLRGAVRIHNILPQALSNWLQPALSASKAGGDAFTGSMPPGQLALPSRFNWEAESMAAH